MLHRCGHPRDVFFGPCAPFEELGGTADAFALSVNADALEQLIDREGARVDANATGDRGRRGEDRRRKCSDVVAAARRGIAKGDNDRQAAFLQAMNRSEHLVARKSAAAWAVYTDDDPANGRGILDRAYGCLHGTVARERRAGQRIHAALSRDDVATDVEDRDTGALAPTFDAL